MKSKKWLGKVCFLSIGTYITFFLGSALIYPKTKINHLTKIAEAETFDETHFFDIHHTSEKGSLFISKKYALDLRCELIDLAKKELYITQYAIENDDTGDLFIQHLIKAANRGVKIHLICNGMAMKWKMLNFYKQIALGAHPNIELRIYGGINLLTPWTVNNVMHDKLMIVDQQYFLSSGRNIGDRFMLGDMGDKNTYDMDVLIKATGYHHPIIDEGKKYFDQIWNSPYTKKGLAFESLLSKKIVKWSEQKLITNFPKLEKKYTKEMSNNSLEKLSFESISQARLLHNNPDENVKQPIIWQTISKMLNSSKSMTLQTPYLVLDSSMMRYLDRQKLQKCSKDILTNSEATSPNLFAYSAYLDNKKRDLTLFNIDEYQGKGSIHNKAFIYGQDMIGVGSFNTDPRSSFLDSENMLVLKSEGMTEQLRQIINHYKHQSLKCQTSMTYQESPTIKVKKVQWIKKKMMAILSIIIKPFSYLT